MKEILYLSIFKCCSGNADDFCLGQDIKKFIKFHWTWTSPKYIYNKSRYDRLCVISDQPVQVLISNFYRPRSIIKIQEIIIPEEESIDNKKIDLKRILFKKYFSNITHSPKIWEKWGTMNYYEAMKNTLENQKFLKE